jgi:tRNA-intron endonuclease
VTGVLRDDATVLVSDPSEAGTVYGRGFFGTVRSEGLVLDRPESVYLAEMGRLPIVDDGGRELLWTAVLHRAVDIEPEFLIRYLVYRDLRQRGYVVRESPPPARFAVLPRGGVLHKTPARFWVEPISERTPFDIAALSALFEHAHGSRKTLLLAVVDEESDLTYYRVTSPTPHGTRPGRIEATPATAFVTQDRVLLYEPAAVETLGREAGFGSRIGSRLELSFVEAAFLGEQGALHFRSAASGRGVSVDSLLRRAARVDDDFAVRRAAYAWLRGRGLVVKTGFKYGAHFRAYVRDPEHTHARYLIQSIGPEFRAPWPSVAGHVRLAQGVRKEFILIVVGENGECRCLALERIRP